MQCTIVVQLERIRTTIGVSIFSNYTCVLIKLMNFEDAKNVRLCCAEDQKMIFYFDLLSNTKLVLTMHFNPINLSIQMVIFQSQWTHIYSRGLGNQLEN